MGGVGRGWVGPLERPGVAPMATVGITDSSARNVASTVFVTFWSEQTWLFV